MKKTHEVFGVSNTILEDSYVDRGHLDSQLKSLLERKTHIALRGESKCGKSWIRQNNVPEAVVVQCRFGMKIVDIYTDALSQLEIRLEIESKNERSLNGKITASGSIGAKILAKLGIEAEIGVGDKSENKIKYVGHDINDLRYIADIIKASDRRLVVEDFHYLSVPERKYFAFDLKALWDYGLFVIIIGVWSQSNMLLSLNPDLSGRIFELSIYWDSKDLIQVLVKGGMALKVTFSEDLKNQIVKYCFANVGILQAITLGVLDSFGIQEEQGDYANVSGNDHFETSALKFVDQLNPIYQLFAKNVAGGIRTKKDSTGIYLHAMAIILNEEDEYLIKGLSLNRIHEKAHAREPRIRKGNLRRVLQRFEELQVDTDGRGIVLSYNEAIDEIIVVDRQLLLYRSFSTVKWPWEDMIKEIESSNNSDELFK